MSAGAAGRILDLSGWARTAGVDPRPWLLLGKGPSYEKIRGIDLAQFRLCALNHVVRERPVDLAHAIDLDVVIDCAAAFDANARFLAMPHRPHVRNDPGSKTLDRLADEVPVLGKLRREGRLVGYNLSTARPVVEGPVVRAKFFSAEAALHLLALSGARTVRSLGLDGGAEYAPTFADLAAKTLLANSHKSFDLQFDGISRTIRETGVFYAPLDREAPIRVFVGASEALRLPTRVLEYSIRRHARMSVEFTPMIDLPVPVPKDPGNRPRTGFSFARFLIPSLCEGRGRAIYLDADMLVFEDLARLWDFPRGGADLLCAEQPTDRGRIRQFSVLLLDCEQLPWRIEEIVRGLDEGAYDYRRLLFDLCIVPEARISPALPFEWNSLEHYEKGRTCLLHYTDMPTQPWVHPDNPNGDLWYDSLREALDEGFLAPEEVLAEAEKGHVFPELPRRVGLPDPPDLARLRAEWNPPYRALAAAGGASRSAGPPLSRRAAGWVRRIGTRLRRTLGA